MDKLVSVIIPTYKRFDTLSTAIQSVIEQTYNNIEIIVVDDNDPDTTYRKNTESIMEKYKNCSNIKYIKHERNKNGSAARNTGFRNSRGDYIMYLDDDDEFLPEKVESQLSCLEELDASWGACYTNYIRKKDGKIIAYGAEKKQGFLLNQELARNLFIHAGSNLMVRREVVEEVGGFNEKFQRNQDIEFLVKVLIKYKLAYVDKLGLIVNIYHKPGLFDFEQITKQYIKEFSSVIKTLSNEEQKTIFCIINLQLFRYYLTKQRNFKKSIKHIMVNKIPIGMVLQYMVYLAKRRITKKAYGFKIRS